MSEWAWTKIGILVVVLILLTLVSRGMEISHEGTMRAIEKGYRPIEKQGIIVWQPNDCR